MKKIKHKGFLIALVSALIISSSFIACDMKGNKSNVENEKANLENNTQKDEASSNKENPTDNTSEKSNSNAEATNNRFEGLKTTSEDMNIPVLCYHDVTPNNPNNNELLVNPEKFKEQLQYLKDNNYTPITLDELYDYLRNNKPIPEKSVVITLDDGYKGNYEYAYPLLKEFKFPATIFVISNYVGAQDYMTADQLKEMSNNGIEIESHTFKHDDLSTLDEAKQLETLKDSKVALEKIIGKPVDFVAYPFGRYNSSTRVAAEKAGYKLGFNLNGNFTDRKDNNFNMDRIYVSNNDSLQKFESRLTGK
ncbi:polysaccharide deacetylase family protein [Clostridium perfringens]|uniref:Polysaccharide deacetylase family protein n=2 Tax=Clostridium perfringens TaxID=1502 RepID=A0AAE8FQY0_CLOPF|nr:polysaccharide deacetylase family protein [Clostridium perfringens]EIF6289939.1 polysaccharide deacetylase family protein [Clostridium perfringens]EJT6477854.1 polysaccharide deacetylase family protein [Clostridium perfringens]MBI6056581.1 polysaccharide deacetylase family protein [Clostridium perfringens]MBI6060683.1 polysaccharide deacetylase family protein [Clostridium perfringens]MCC5433511.1 polysaccharide deacetylase family protein [Clostridium perfringens]